MNVSGRVVVAAGFLRCEWEVVRRRLLLPCCLCCRQSWSPACALSASEATKAIVVSMTFCRVGYFIGRQLIRNSGFMSRLFFGVLQVQKRGLSRTHVCAMAWLKSDRRRLPKLQDSPGPSRPAFSSLFCNGLSSSRRNVCRMKRPRANAPSFEKAKTEF